MKSNNNYFYWLIVTAIIILILTLFKSCEYIDNANQKINQMRSLNKGLTAKIQKDSSVIYSQRIMIAESDEQMQSYEDEILSLKRLNFELVNSAVEIRTNVIIKDTIFIADPITCNNSKHLQLPAPFSKSTRFYSITASIDTFGFVRFDSINIPATITYAVGDTLRKGFFNRIQGKRDKVSKLHIDNPYVNVSGLSSIYLVRKKRWFETTGFKVLVGFGLGVAVSQVK